MRFKNGEKHYPFWTSVIISFLNEDTVGENYLLFSSSVLPCIFLGALFVHIYAAPPDPPQGTVETLRHNSGSSRENLHQERQNAVQQWRVRRKLGRKWYRCLSRNSPAALGKTKLKQITIWQSLEDSRQEHVYPEGLQSRWCRGKVCRGRTSKEELLWTDHNLHFPSLCAAHEGERRQRNQKWRSEVDRGKRCGVGGKLF